MFKKIKIMLKKNELSELMDKSRSIMDMKNTFVNSLKSLMQTSYDIGMIPELYKVYKSFSKDFSGDIRGRNTKQFVMSVLVMFSPESVFGGEINKKLRAVLTNTLDFKSDSMLYYMRDKSVAWYSLYSDFAKEVDEALYLLLKMMGDKNQ